MRTVFACLLLAIASTLHAQIVVPERVEPYQPIVASLATELPEGAQIQGGWSCDSARWIAVNPRLIHVWAKPGTHKLNFRGAWVQTQSVTLPDGSVIQAFIGFGFIDDSVEFVVGTPSPPEPEPGPDPLPPPQPKAGVIVAETSEITPTQAALFSQVALQLPNVYRLDPDQLVGPLWSKIAQAVRDSKFSLPVLAVVGSDGDVIRVVRCPMSVDGVKTEVAK